MENNGIALEKYFEVVAALSNAYKKRFDVSYIEHWKKWRVIVDGQRFSDSDIKQALKMAIAHINKKYHEQKEEIIASEL